MFYYPFSLFVLMLLEPLYRDAIIFSSLLTLLSLGLTLTFLTTKVPNFCHGSLATLGIYVSLTFDKVFLINVYYSLPFAFLLSGFIALLQYILVLKPLSKRGASVITLMVATIAFELILLAALNIYADYIARIFKITSRYFFLRGSDFRFANQQGLLFVAPLIVIIVSLTLYIFLTKTKFGIAMRATIENPSLAGSVGINPDLVYRFSWFLSGGLAGLAGGLLPLSFIGNPDTGSFLLISIFAASISGGLFHIFGGLIGGYLIGFAEVLGTANLASLMGTWVIPYRPVIPLLAMALTLLLIPRGITGLSFEFLKSGNLWRKLKLYF